MASGWGFPALPDFSDISSLSEIGERFQKFKEEVEHTIETSIRGDQLPGLADGGSEGEGCTAAQACRPGQHSLAHPRR